MIAFLWYFVLINLQSNNFEYIFNINFHWSCSLCCLSVCLRSSLCLFHVHQPPFCLHVTGGLVPSHPTPRHVLNYMQIETTSVDHIINFLPQYRNRSDMSKSTEEKIIPSSSLEMHGWSKVFGKAMNLRKSCTHQQ